MRSGLLLLCAIAALLAESTAGVKWTAPAGWVSKGTAPMRAATYTVGDAECVVYFFGQGQGGSVEANLARWNGQFTRNGAPAVAKTAKRTVHGFYAGMAGPMTSPQAPQADYRMLAAIVENPNGNLFVKFTGPVKTVTANEPKFEQLVASFQKE